MQHRVRWRRVVQGVLASAAVVAFAPPALADECQDDGDCGHGYVCETFPSRGCPTIDIACVDGMECPKPPACEAEDISVCVPSPCESDADCGDAMVCYTRTSERCSGAATPGCEPGQECKPAVPIEPECETYSESTCVQPWVPPCEEDADCGPGFRCVEEIERGCSGSAGSPSPDSGEPAPPPPPPSCFENPTGRFVCQLADLPCSADSDCAAGLTCESNPIYPVCDSAGGSDGDGDADRAPDDCGAATNGVPRQVCLPPGYLGDGSSGVGRGEDGSLSTANGGQSTDDRAAGAPNDVDENAPEAEEAAGPRHVRSGCSAAAAGQAGWLSLSGWLLMVAAALRRRRAR